MNVIGKKSLIDADTGELLYEETEGIALYAWSDKSGYLLHNGKGAVRVHKRLTALELADSDYAKLMRLAVQVNGYGVIVRGDRTNLAMSAPEIAFVIGLSVPRTQSWLKRMQDKAIIRKSGAGYRVNPLYIAGSARLPLDLYQVFQEEIDPLLPEWARDKYKGMG